jgi:hypothetical protein
MTKNRGERGAAAVEMSLVLGLLLMLGIGAYEWGTAFQNYLGVVSASREAARVGASAGADSNADCRILEAAAGALFSVTQNEVVRVEVAERDPDTGTTGSPTSYRPFDPDLDNTANLRCGQWYLLQDSWPSTSRDDQGAERDWVLVSVVYRHHWATGFLWWNGSVEWTNETAMRIEPETF